MSRSWVPLRVPRGGGGGETLPINKNQQLRQKQAKTDYKRMETIWAKLLVDWTILKQTETDCTPWIGLRNQRSQVRICFLEKEKTDIFEKLLMMAKI